MNKAYIGLGSNLNDPITQILSALNSIKLLSEGIFDYSSFYKTKPLDKSNQPDYINAAALIETNLAPLALLTALQSIERNQGRVRTHERWIARTIDLDILLVDHLVINSSILMLPHPGITQRDFVLKPLLEITPDIALPNGQVLRDLLPCAEDNALICLGQFKL